MHAVSASHTGLQGDFATLIDQNGQQQSPDEAVTDYFGYQIYKKIFGDNQNYETGYWVGVDKNAVFGPRNEHVGYKFEDLPVVWSGQIVDIFKDVLGLEDDSLLKEAYFKNPENFKKLADAQKDEIKKSWEEFKSNKTLEKYNVFDTKQKEILLDEVIENNKDTLETLPDSEWAGFVKEKIKADVKQKWNNNIGDIEDITETQWNSILDFRPYYIKDKIRKLINKEPELNTSTLSHP